MLERLADTAVLARYDAMGIEGEVTAAKLVVGLLLLVFTVVEIIPATGTRTASVRSSASVFG